MQLFSVTQVTVMSLDYSFFCQYADMFFVFFNVATQASHYNTEPDWLLRCFILLLHDQLNDLQEEMLDNLYLLPGGLQLFLLQTEAVSLHTSVFW